MFVYDLSRNSYSASCIYITAMHHNWFDYGLVAYTDSDTSSCHNLFYISHHLLRYAPARCLTSSTCPPFSTTTYLNVSTCLTLSLFNVEFIYCMFSLTLRIFFAFTSGAFLSRVFCHPQLYTTGSARLPVQFCPCQNPRIHCKDVCTQLFFPFRYFNPAHIITTTGFSQLYTNSPISAGYQSCKLWKRPGAQSKEMPKRSQ